MWQLFVLRKEERELLRKQQNIVSSCVLKIFYTWQVKYFPDVNL